MRIDYSRKSYDIFFVGYYGCIFWSYLYLFIFLLCIYCSEGMVYFFNLEIL